MLNAIRHACARHNVALWRVVRGLCMCACIRIVLFLWMDCTLVSCVCMVTWDVVVRVCIFFFDGTGVHKQWLRMEIVCTCVLVYTLAYFFACFFHVLGFMKLCVCICICMHACEGGAVTRCMCGTLSYGCENKMLCTFFLCVYKYVWTDMYTHTHACICMYVATYVCTYAQIWFMNAYLCVCVCVCVFVSICLFIHECMHQCW